MFSQTSPCACINGKDYRFNKDFSPSLYRVFPNEGPTSQSLYLCNRRESHSCHWQGQSSRQAGEAPPASSATRRMGPLLGNGARRPETPVFWLPGAHWASAPGSDLCKPPWTCFSVITPFSLPFVTLHLVICETVIFLKVTLVRITAFTNNNICTRGRTYIRSQRIVQARCTTYLQ